MNSFSSTQAPDARTIVWRERQRQNGGSSASQYGTYYGKPSFESADETLDESKLIILIRVFHLLNYFFLLYSV